MIHEKPGTDGSPAGEPQSPLSGIDRLAVFVVAFLGPFLLFQLQPIAAKLLLPRFGGTPAVWSACSMFFQIALLVGYAAALAIDRRCAARRQLLFFLLVVASALPLLPWHGTSLSRVPDMHPAMQVVILLIPLIGYPFTALAMLSPLLQSVAARMELVASPYRLYALSNAGSLAALLMYPSIVERALPIDSQLRMWSWLFVLFACLIARLAVVTSGRTESGAVTGGEESTRIDLPLKALWIALPAASTTILLAFTNHICADIAPIPLLWIVPLALYLLSFIVAFGGDRYYARQWLWPIAALLLVGINANTITGPNASTAMILGFTLLSLFVLCLICHGELYRLRPPSSALPLYYLCIAFGGALGGTFVGLLAPVLFGSLAELPVGLGGSLAAVVTAGWYSRYASMRRAVPRRIAIAAALCIAVVLSVVIVHTVTLGSAGVASVRNFFGVVTVRDSAPKNGDRVRSMIVGRIIHGAQSLDPSRRLVPTTYYSRETALGELLSAWKRPAPLRVGAVGLGVGTIAAYSEPGDVFRFYEINPNVIELAQRYFFFLADAKGTMEIIEGDARLQLESESSRGFDLIVLDAFSGDAIPVHLLTMEAFATYIRHLGAHGMIAVHLTNRHVNLRPVLRAAASRFGKWYCSRADDAPMRVSYVFLASEPIDRENFDCIAPPFLGLEVREWTDQFASIVPLFTW